MQLKQIKLGNLTTENNVFLAPLAGYTDFAFRGICRSFGAGLTFTEMVSAKGLIYDNQNTVDLLRISEKEKIKAVQLFGSEPAVMRRACESEYLKDFDVVDINMGCPVPKLFKNGEGSALLNDIDLAEKVVKECVKSGKIITVKMRIGAEKGRVVAVEFAKMLEQSGVSLITIHGRMREAYYSGEPDYETIAKAKSSVTIPLIANGGIFTKDDADLMQEKTGADGVMLARGALYKPSLFSEITGKTYINDIFFIVSEHIDELKKYYPDEWVAKNMRKQISLYLKGVRNSASLRQRLMNICSTSEMKDLIKGTF